MSDNAVCKIVRVSDEKYINIGPEYEWDFMAGGIEGFGEFEKNISFVDSAIGDGGSITGERMGKKQRTIKCAYKNLYNNPIARRKMTEFLKPYEEYKVYMTYANRTRWAPGKIKKMSLGMHPKIKRLLVLMATFEFEKPYLRSYDDFGKDIAGKTASAGFPYLAPRSGPKKGHITGRLNFSQIVDLYNDGDAKSNCRILIKAKGGVENPKVMINDYFVKINDILKEGDEIEMDFTKDPPTIKKNGVNCMGRADRLSDFDNMDLAIGDNTIQYDADAGSNLMSVSVYYNKLYGAM